MPSRHDGPASPNFHPLPFAGNLTFDDLASATVSEVMRASARRAPSGACTGWGIPFEIGKPLLVRTDRAELELGPVKAEWLVFAHTTDLEPLDADAEGLIRPMRGAGRLGEPVAEYVLVYADGSESRRRIRRRHEVGMVRMIWGESCFEAVAMRKPHPLAAAHERDPARPPANRRDGWGTSQTRGANPDLPAWGNHLWAWRNPRPRKSIVALRVEPLSGTLVLSGIAAGTATSLPLRWEPRRKAHLALPEGATWDGQLDENGLLAAVRLDLGQVISARPRLVYPDGSWSETADREPAGIAPDEILVEYTAHPDACFHLAGGRTIPVSGLKRARAPRDPGSHLLTPIPAATQRVRLRIVDKASKKPIAVKLHAHGGFGEYLAPVDRHRIPNPSWFEDYGTDLVVTDPTGRAVHHATYVPGETVIDLPPGRVYLEISRGFEMKPVRKVVDVTERTRTLTVALEKVLPWRERGWVTADTHVHFLSPKTAELEGAAEGVNVINLLASQWGELMTNVGDFDGKTTFGSKEAGGDGEWLVRVGTENRQHVLGHISLLGYGGDIIAPMCTGGADESALGDPVEVLMTEWARKCRAQGGLVVFPHFPHPRAENAAALVHGDVDAVEMCSVLNPYGGIDPYSLSDWYRYLNCGYFYPAVGGTDKMAATTAVGTIRTYARIPDGTEFSYSAWMDAVRSGNTFVTYGPLLELAVDGRSAGQRIAMKRSGGSVEVEYEVASVTVPMTRVDLVVNGEIRESREVAAARDRGRWSVKLDRSSWIAILVRGRYRGRETVAAHSSPVVVDVAGSRFFAAADAVTILEQIEGAIAYLDTVGTRADERSRKRMRLVLTAAHRKLHNEMHRHGKDHRHAAAQAHTGHRSGA